MSQEVTMEIRKYFEMKENKNTTYPNLWAVIKIALSVNVCY